LTWLSDTTIDHLRGLAEAPDFEGTRYRVEREIGRGGMGIVYVARDTALHRDVAIKVLNTAMTSTTMVDRMLRESKIIAKLEHPGIVPVHDAGTLKDGRVFYVMKFIRGESLNQTVESLGSINDRLRIFLKACEAVAFAHANGVVHRDLKPENIMLGPFGEVLVMDWGTAKILDREHLEADQLPKQQAVSGDCDTSHGLVIGTPGYMSPEQASAGIVDQRSDVFSLGAVLHFLLHMNPPSEASTLIAADSSPNSQSSRNFGRQVPRALQAICDVALSPEPSRRYPQVEELATDVSRFLDGEPVCAYKENVLEKITRWLGRHRFLVLLVLAYLIMRILLLIFSPR
jgi:eukaryotic-like serine/threonine-protein kinase